MPFFDMTTDIFAATSYGQAALKKLAPVDENFRLYEAGWLGEKPADWTVMKVVGATFRAAKTGPNKGKLVVMVKGSKRTAYVTKDEMARFKDKPELTAPVEPQQ